MKRRIKIAAAVLVLILLAAVVPAYRFLDFAFGKCISKDVEVKVYPGDGCDSLVMRLGDAVNPEKFVSYYGRYFKDELSPGFYKFRSGTSERVMLRALKLGFQTPVRVTFNNVSTLETLAGKVSRCFLADSVDFLKCFKNEAANGKFGVSREMFPKFFIPDTYEMYWTSTPEKFVERMVSEYEKFWNDDRKSKASKLGLTPDQVVIIASIVDKETTYAPDRTKIAGVYINRLRKGMPLQADPTVKFALGDPSIRRVLERHLQVESPYNTYKYAGLPPGPISMPDRKVIDAVLDYKGHKYLYFCAAADLSGRSEFAETLSQHSRNAKAYQAQLNKLKIY